jgi:predicted enzyme related to lactoylglutathione lyase
MKPGRVGWIDLTVEDAELIRDFYAGVVGWTHNGVDMEGYQDYTMHAPDDGEPLAWVCHARGGNAELPPVWLVYFVVADLDGSLERCKALGGTIESGPKTTGSSRYCVVADPAGAVCALVSSED